MYYSNGFNCTFEELISFYPTFYRDVLEMRAILEAEGTLIDDTIATINRIIDNSFIDTADEATIKKLETFLHITADATSTLGERRRYVKLYFTGFGKISASEIKETLYPFTQTECEITFKPADEAKNNLLSIIIPRGNTDHFSALDVMKLLARRIPAHLWYGVTIVHQNSHDLYFGIATTFVREIQIHSADEDIMHTVFLFDEAGDMLVDENNAVLTD